MPLKECASVPSLRSPEPTIWAAQRKGTRLGRFLGHGLKQSALALVGVILLNLPATALESRQIEIVQSMIPSMLNKSVAVTGVVDDKTKEMAERAVKRQKILVLDGQDPLEAIFDLTQTKAHPYGTWLGHVACNGMDRALEYIVYPLNGRPKTILSLSDAPGGHREIILTGQFIRGTKGTMRIDTLGVRRGDRDWRKLKTTIPWDKKQDQISGTFEAMGCTAFELSRQKPVNVDVEPNPEGYGDPNTVFGRWYIASSAANRDLRQLRPVGKLSSSAYDITYVQSDIAMATRVGGDLSEKAYEIKKRKELPFLEATSNRQDSLRLGNLETILWLDGAQILRSSRGAFLVRFPVEEAAEILASAGAAPASFCSGPVQNLAAKALDASFDAAELMGAYPESLRSVQLGFAPMHALLGNAFSEEFGRGFAELSDRTKHLLFDRLMVCALFSEEGTIRDGLEASILSQMSSNDIRATLDLDMSARGRGKVSFRISPERAGAAMRNHKDAVEAISTLVDRIAEEPEAVAAEFALIAPNLPLERVLEIASVLEPVLFEAREEQLLAEEAELPALPDTVKMGRAAGAYFGQNCQAFVRELLIKAGPSNPLGGMIWASAQGSGSACRVPWVNFELVLGIGAIQSHTCTSGDLRKCSGTFNFTCALVEGQSLGSLGSSIDPLCPVIESTPLSLEGTFEELSHRRWKATDVFVDHVR